MANLAIKGHPTRGRDIIQLLEMLGGRNSNNCTGQYINRIYFINKYGYIESTDDIKLQLYCATYNLEEFEEKFPYKVGDKILYKVYGIYSKIKSMLWNKEKEQVFYRLESNKLFVATADELNQYKEETMEEKGTLVQIDLTREMNVNDEVEVILGDYEFVLKDGKTYFIKKKPQYPKTYEECCKELGHPAVIMSDYVLGYKGSLLNSLQELLICRDAYWKIARDWKPDSLNPTKEIRYFLFCTGITIEKGQSLFPSNKILIFPAEEMRDAFFENFKDLIEKCKELL